MAHCSKKQRRIVAFILLLSMVMAISSTIAESGSDFIDYVDSFFLRIMDLSEKEAFVVNATGTSPDIGEVMFDFSEGNNTLLAIADAKCKVYAYFEHDELLSMLFHMITVFDEIDAATPGKNLVYNIRLSDGDTFVLDSNSIAKYFSNLVADEKPEIGKKEISEFQLRNGILFGDSMPSVKSKETFPARNSGGKDYLSYYGDINNNEADICFHFDESGKLYDVNYFFLFRNENDCETNYSFLYEEIIQKYGAPLEKTDSTYPIVGSAYDTFAEMKERNESFGGECTRERYDEWIIDDANGHVKIDLLSYHANSKYSDNYATVLSYRHYTDDDYPNQ